MTQVERDAALKAAQKLGAMIRRRPALTITDEAREEAREDASREGAAS